jgi:hypothetical protein
VIELFTADTPNGKKNIYYAREIGYEYKVTKVDLAIMINLKKNL